MTVIGEAVPVPVRVTCPDEAHVTVKPVIALPPFVPGVNEIVACALPPVAVPMAGAAGAVFWAASTTVPLTPALLVGELVAVAPLRSIDSVPSVGTDTAVKKAAPAKSSDILLVKTNPLGMM